MEITLKTQSNTNSHNRRLLTQVTELIIKSEELAKSETDWKLLSQFGDSLNAKISTLVHQLSLNEIETKNLKEKLNLSEIEVESDEDRNEDQNDLDKYLLKSRLNEEEKDFERMVKVLLRTSSNVTLHKQRLLTQVTELNIKDKEWARRGTELKSLLDTERREKARMKTSFEIDKSEYQIKLNSLEFEISKLRKQLPLDEKMEEKSNLYETEVEKLKIDLMNSENQNQNLIEELGISMVNFEKLVTENQSLSHTHQNLNKKYQSTLTKLNKSSSKISGESVKRSKKVKVLMKPLNRSKKPTSTQIQSKTNQSDKVGLDSDLEEEQTGIDLNRMIPNDGWILISGCITKPNQPPLVDTHNPYSEPNPTTSSGSSRTINLHFTKQKDNQTKPTGKRKVNTIDITSDDDEDNVGLDKRNREDEDYKEAHVKKSRGRPKKQKINEEQDEVRKENFISKNIVPRPRNKGKKIVGKAGIGAEVVAVDGGGKHAKEGKDNSGVVNDIDKVRSLILRIKVAVNVHSCDHSSLGEQSIPPMPQARPNEAQEGHNPHQHQLFEYHRNQLAESLLNFDSSISDTNDLDLTFSLSLARGSKFMSLPIKTQFQINQI
ncbi:uncharacterized protein MELLADRAFT_105761 [Melampsora larici-populina 98AG31]|uniref:Uncharacterized protein n=1 Tax=Melampsora larici-populina (strain 98AG31 / pathotype 3-4-7) TaxID=747676 RepID=F4RJ86_MELLP|nr:uncharacterized protein MELLADRAFT_105761 [Melampsora larici-populina 98AG31]EGG07276.1 hypothetical protein MELLADRAFT_105761 [Melampsora larici-populina 98AG31]